MVCVTLLSVASLHSRTLLEAAHSSHVFVKKINMFFPYCLQTICYIFKETKDLPIHFGIHVQKTCSVFFLKKNGIHLNMTH